MNTLKSMSFVCCTAFLGMATAERAQAVPVTFGSNAYEYVTVANPLTGTNNNWGTAEANANASVFLGVNGHLATITSVAENSFLAGLVTVNPTGFAGAWIGGRDGVGWLTGPENTTAFGYTNWNVGEPNNSGFAYMGIGDSNVNGGLIGTWYDDSNGFVAGVDPLGHPDLADPVVGYFVEYENVSAVPLPAAFPLFGTGLGILGFLGWRRRRQAQAV